VRPDWHTLAPGDTGEMGIGGIMDTANNIEDTLPRARPGFVTALAVLQFVGSAVLLVTILVGYQGISETMSGAGLSWQNLSIATILYAMLGIAAGIGMWRGKPWGWWLAAFSYFYGILRNISALMAIPEMVGAFGEPARGTIYYYGREIGQIGWGVLITAYWFSGSVREYFGLAQLSRVRALLTLAAVSILIIGAGFLLPGAVDRDLERIGTLYEQGDVLAALDELEQYLESNPENYLAWTILGHARLDVGDLAGSQAAYDRAIEINPEGFQAWTGLGVLNRILGDRERAMQCYEEALEINPNYADAHSSMAILALQLHQDAEALEHAERAYEIDKRSPVIAANLAVIYHYNGMDEERDAMTAEAEKLGYENMDGLQMVYDGAITIREQ